MSENPTVEPLKEATAEVKVKKPYKSPLFTCHGSANDLIGGTIAANKPGDTTSLGGTGISD